MKYAVIRTGGKQYKVEEGKIFTVGKIPKAEAEDVTFDDVLLLRDNDQLKIGQPVLTNVKVTGKIVAQTKSKKIIVFKKKRRKGYRRKAGHRQQITRVEIKEIKVES